MASDFSGQNILINDNFKSKRISLSNLTDNCSTYETDSLIPNKDVLKFKLDDIQFLKTIPGGYYDFGDYHWSADYPDPRTEENNSWGLYENLVANCNVGSTTTDILPLLKGEGVWINDTSTGAVAYYYKQLTSEQQEQIKSTGSGESTFTIAIPPILVNRAPNYNFTNITRVGYDFFKDKPDQVSFVTFGAYDNNRPNLQFRFVVNFRNIWDEATQSWTVHVAKSIGDPLDETLRIEGWDGMSFRKFKFEYEPIVNNIIGQLYMFDESTNEWNLIKENFIASQDAATYTNAPEFGSYSSNGRSSIVVRDFNFKAFIRSEYRYTFDKKYFQSSIALADYCYDYYEYNVGGTGNILVDWFFNNKQNTIDLSTGKININKDWFSPDDSIIFNKLQKKDKEIKLYGDPNSITSFNNPNKKIASINLRNVPNLQELNLSYNNLTSIDLSKNINLQRINLSNNVELTDIILPKGINSSITQLNVSNTKIKNFELIDTRATKPAITLDISNLILLESLNIQGLKLENPETFAEQTLPDTLKYVNISETNILTNRTNLKIFLSKLPERQNTDTGIIYMYGKKYTADGIQGSAKAIAQSLETLKYKNWIFYL